MLRRIMMIAIAAIAACAATSCQQIARYTPAVQIGLSHNDGYGLSIGLTIHPPPNDKEDNQ